MKSRILYIFTRTPLHVGAGASVGAIDQPVQRERHTGFPVIPGSSLKGVLADQYLERAEDGSLKKDGRGRAVRTADGTLLFGRQDHEVNIDEGHTHKAGDISIGEARLLAFPVRSAKGCFAWITSPLVVGRWVHARGKNLIGCPRPEDMDLYGDSTTLAHDGTVVIEDYAFNHRAPLDPIEGLTTAFPNSLWSELAPQHLCLISDDMMAHLARTACEVAQHVSINDETGAAEDRKLFNQENVPAETLFYSCLTELRSGSFDKLTVSEPFQIGGDATTGLGYCSTHVD